MRQKIANKLTISVDGVDLTSLKKIEFYLRQALFFQTYTPTVVNSTTMVIEIPKVDADKLRHGNVDLQFAFTDAAGIDDASDVTTVGVDVLLNPEGYHGC